MSKKIVVIGGGIGGLATAALLAKDGHQVTLIEKNESLGGRARFLAKKGFHFDMGPSWYMMPDAFENYFKLFDKKPTDFYELLPLKPHYTVLIEDREYTIDGSIENTQKLFESIEPGTGPKLKQFINKSEYLYNAAMKQLVYIDYESLGPLLSPQLLLQLFTLNLLESYHDAVKKHFKNKDLQKILEFMTVFLGGSPYITPAFYTLIAHTDFNLKIWHPKGGMYQVIEALISLCKQYKVSIVTNEPVKKIEITDGRASNVITTKKRYEADAVVVNADYAYAEMNFLEKKWQSYSEKFWGKQTLSPSSILVYIGLNKKIKTKAHHYLYFDRSWEQHFDDVYVNKILPEHPSYYVNTPTHTDPSLAPPGKDMLIFLIPVAAGLSNTQQEYQDLADKTICHFEKTINQSFIKDIEIKEYFSPIDFEKSYNAYKGSAFGIAHTLFQTGPFRPRNKSKKVSNLYYVGQYTNPGIGLPICIISAQIVARLIEKYEA